MKRTIEPGEEIIRNKLMSWIYFNHDDTIIFFKQCCNLCSDESRKYGVHGVGNKYKKRHKTQQVHKTNFGINTEEIRLEEIVMKTIILEEQKDKKLKIKALWQTTIFELNTILV